MAKQVKCKGCGKKIEKNVAYCHVHITKTGNKQNNYYCSKEEFEDIKKEKDYLLKCKYATDRILGEYCTNNVRNKKLSELHKKGYSYEEIYQCISDLERSLDYAVANKWNEFTNEYNKIAYIFGAIEKEVDKYKGKSIKEEKTETVDSIEEYKGNTNKNKNDKPTLMDLIRKGRLNGR